MPDNSYFQFPLCALAYGESENLRLNAIIDYATIETGIKLWAKMTTADRDVWLEDTVEIRPYVEDFRYDNELHCATVYGAFILKVTIRSIGATIQRREKLREHIAAFESRNGRDAQVRIKTGWLFNARDNSGLNYREFAVLCAIYSVIGRKQLTRITRNRINRSALGYRTAAILEKELTKRKDGAKLLTERQLRNTIAALHRNKFFARCTYARRVTYYSIRLGGEALRKEIIARRTYASYFHTSQSGMDQAMTASIKAKLAGLPRHGAVTPVPRG